MKLKIISSFLLLCILSSMCSCNTYGNNNSINSDSINQNTESDIINETVTESQTESQTLDIDIIVDYVSLTLCSKQEYDYFVNSYDMPDNFITYDMLNELGEFQALFFPIHPRTNNSLNYVYSLVDESGFELTLYVDPVVEYQTFHSDKDEAGCIDSIESIDMRCIEEEAPSTRYYHGNIRYGYIYGHLSSVSWIHDEIQYTLYSDLGMGDYPNIETTVAGKLLNKEKANEALEDFLNSMTK